jgi:hypothetical protein
MRKLTPEPTNPLKWVKVFSKNTDLSAFCEASPSNTFNNVLIAFFGKDTWVKAIFL